MSEALEVLRQQAACRSIRPAFTWQGGAISYAALLRRVLGAAGELAQMPPVVGLLAEDGIDWVIADLAASAAGKTLVPIPRFFSQQQILHLLADAGVSHVLCDDRLQPQIRPAGIPCSSIPQAESSSPVATDANGGRIIYTSGSTGTPKGVRLAGGQITHSVKALAEASQARADDRHLSVLPFSLLLEQICGIYLVLHVGAQCHIAAGVAEACGDGDPAALLRSCAAERPTTTVLVPQLLAALVGACVASGAPAPDSLRFVAVGGAAVPATLLEAAWRCGIPACLGYGLSECCSVVSVNRPGSRSISAGPPLPGVTVEIDGERDGGEIVVSGPSVMQGYLGGPDPRGRWRTGDLGYFDADGNLVVVGRKDNLLVTPNGRNISPEWIEGLIERDPLVARCVVVCNAEGSLTAVVTPTEAQIEAAALVEIVRLSTGGAPSYARPSTLAIAPEHLIASEGLLNVKGEPRRALFARHFGNPAIRHHKIEPLVEFATL